MLLLGTVIGIAATTGFQHFRRAQAIRSLPSLADRNHPPGIDEFAYVTLSRREGRLEYDLRNSMGGPLKDFDALIEFERVLGDEPLLGINFESGVTADDIEETVATLSKLGVKRYFIGSIYGKSVLQ